MRNPPRQLRHSGRPRPPTLTARLGRRQDASTPRPSPSTPPEALDAAIAAAPEAGEAADDPPCVIEFEAEDGGEGEGRRHAEVLACAGDYFLLFGRPRLAEAARAVPGVSHAFVSACARAS